MIWIKYIYLIKKLKKLYFDVCKDNGEIFTETKFYEDLFLFNWKADNDDEEWMDLSKISEEIEKMFDYK